MPIFLAPELVQRLLQEAGSTIISLKFIKRTTGEERELVGMLKVSKYVNGKGKSFKDEDQNLQTIFDVNIAKELPENQRNRAYRSFGVESVIWMRVNGVEYIGGE